MNYKTSIIAGIAVISILFAAKAGTVRAAVAVPETHMEERTEEEAGESVREELTEEELQEEYAEILEKIRYIQVGLGECYPGSLAEYDVQRGRTILKPHNGEKQMIFREKDKAVIYYGRYRGSQEYDDYQLVSPTLDIGFFLAPFRSVLLDWERIEADGMRAVIEDEQEIEYFFAPLAFAGVINEEEVSMESVEITFDEEHRPLAVRFHLLSDMLAPAQIGYLEEQLAQTFAYPEEEIFREELEFVREMMKDTAEEEEITIADYVTDLANILRAKDEYFIQRLTHQGEELSYRAGWDKKAVFAYLEAVDTKFNAFGENGYEAGNVTQAEYLQELEHIYKSAHQIGSDVYTYMFEASEIMPKKKALLVIRQMGGYIDQNGMLQMGDGDTFSPEMAPHATFLEDYAETVRLAYRKKGQKYRQLDNGMIHQFRMYIDRHNIEYIRKYYDGATDYERLKEYAKSYQMKLYYGEPSRHHNKIGKNSKFETQRYDKILTPNRLSEFIIDVKTGEFVTEWDVLVKDKKQSVLSAVERYTGVGDAAEQKIVDTESFNYAPADYAEAHNSLDVLPASPPEGKKQTVYLENGLKQAMKKIWESPRKRIYREKYKSPKDYLK